jgi:hypothetical protein
MGRFLGGALNAASVKEPVFTPAAPSPAMARPTISATDDGATAHIKLPISNIKMATKNVILKLKKP